MPDAAAHPSPHGGHAHHPALAHHFDNLAQQSEAATLGMWVFLVTEVLFFGGLFCAYSVYRAWYPDAFAAASHSLDITLGAVNTAVLITSKAMGPSASAPSTTETAPTPGKKPLSI